MAVRFRLAGLEGSKPTVNTIVNNYSYCNYSNYKTIVVILYKGQLYPKPSYLAVTCGSSLDCPPCSRANAIF